jgi:type I restriction enzyme S subunit
MGYRPYPSYVPAEASGATTIPKHWDAKRLRFATRLNPSRNEVLLPADASISFIPMDAVGERGGLKLEDECALEDVGAGYTYFANGDVVVAKITPCFENGKGALAAGLTNGVALGTTELHVIRANKDLDPKFLFYLSISAHFRDIGESEMYGAGGQKRIPDTFIKDFRAALPPKSEQLGMVAFLDRETARIDALIAKKRRLLDMLEEKRLAVITHAVTNGLDPTVPTKDSGIEWLGKIPAHWEVLPLTRVVRKFVDYRGSTPTKVSEGVPLITATQIKNGHIDHSLDPVYISEEEYAERMTRGLPRRGDVLVTTEAPLGETAQIEDERVAPGQRIIMMKVDPKKMTDDFLFLYFRSDFGRTELLSRASGSTATGIRADRLRASKVLVPPLNEQIAITRHVLSATEKLPPIIVKIRHQIDVLYEFRSALITNAVTGKIDMRGEVVKEAAA